MRNITAIHMEVDGSDHLEHISKLRWSETNKVERITTNPQESTREQMYNFVLLNKRQAYAISINDNTYAFLEAVDNGHTKYVKTLPDSKTSDNLLSLPRY